ncbi:MAG: hypothetical protein HY897_00830 [Deltaproteobacteria bacterium]|nr:hypothetical protein [Deltaproteobacteria bacterium]
MPDGREAHGVGEAPRPRDLVTAMVVFLLSASLFAGLVHFMDNTNINTRNGSHIAVQLRPWVEGAHDRRLFFANLLYYPVVGWMLRLLRETVFGPIWTRMALVNSVFGGLALGCLFAHARLLRFPVWAAMSMVLFQLGCGFFLFGSITSEDIMPAYAMLMISVTLFAMSERSGSFATLVLSAAAFVLSWLFHWTLVCNLLPACVLAFAAGRGPPGSRAVRAAVFFASVLLLLVVACLAVKGHRGPAGVIAKAIWPGKGLDTGFAGFAAIKINLIFVGISQYLATGKLVAHAEYLRDNLLPTTGKLLFMVLCGISLVKRVAGAWDDGAWRATGILLVSVFACGELFNLYVQPQDPQFQLAPMAWLAFGWGWLCVRVVQAAPRVRRLVAAVLVVAALIPFAWNFDSKSRTRGLDSYWVRAVGNLDARFDRSRTLFVFAGHGDLIVWMDVMGGWKLKDYLRPACESRDPWKFRVFLLSAELILFPGRTPDESAAAVVDYLQAAVKCGLKVVVGGVWTRPRSQFLDLFLMFNDADRTKAAAMYDALSVNFEGVLVSEDPNFVFYELRRRNQRPQ